MLLTRTGGPLNHKAGIAVNSRCQILGQPGFRGTRLADQQQSPVRHQCRYSHLDQPCIADVLGSDYFLAGLPSGDKGQNGTRRHLPAGRNFPGILLAQRLKLLPIQYLRRQPHVILKLLLSR
ncbi:hypothetical protein D3C75_413120 [compost metagenome]